MRSIFYRIKELMSDGFWEQLTMMTNQIAYLKQEVRRLKGED